MGYRRLRSKRAGGYREEKEECNEMGKAKDGRREEQRKADGIQLREREIDGASSSVVLL